MCGGNSVEDNHIHFLEFVISKVRPGGFRGGSIGLRGEFFGKVKRGGHPELRILPEDTGEKAVPPTHRALIVENPHALVVRDQHGCPGNGLGAVISLQGHLKWNPPYFIRLHLGAPVDGTRTRSECQFLLRDDDSVLPERQRDTTGAVGEGLDHGAPGEGGLFDHIAWNVDFTDTQCSTGDGEVARGQEVDR